MLRTNHTTSDEVALTLRHCDGVDALATTLVLGILADGRTLAVALLRQHEQVAVAVGDLHAQHVGIALERDATHAGGVAASRPDFGLIKEDRLAVRRAEDDLLALLDAAHVDQLVILLQVDGNEPVAAAVVVGTHGRLLDHATLRGKDQILVLREVTSRDDCRGMLSLGQCKHVDQCRATCLTRTNGQLMDLDAVDLTLVGEEQHIVMRRSDKQVLDKVIVLERKALHALAATLLGAIRRHRQTLHVACVRAGDNHVLLGDEVLDVEVLSLHAADLRATLVGEARGDLAQLVLDDAQDLLTMLEKVDVVGDARAQVLDLRDELVTGKSSQAAQTHLQDCLALDVIQAKALVHAALRLGVVTRGTDDMNDLVDVVHGDEQALTDVEVLLGLVQVILRAAGHHVDLVVDVVGEHLAQGQRARHAIYERDVDDAKVGLQLRALVQVVEHHLRHGAVLEVDDDAHALAVGLVAHVRDALNMLLIDLLRDTLLQKALVDLVRDLGHHETLATTLANVLDMHLGAHRDGAATGLVGLADALGAHDDATSREVRAGKHLHQVVCGDVGVVNHHADGLGDLTQVVGRHVGGHAHGNARRAVDQQVGESRRQHGRLGERLVVVGLQVDGLLVEVAQHLHGGIGQAALRVAHGCRGVTVDGAKVAVAVNERQAHGEVLRHTHHRVIDGRVTMRVILTHDFADRPRRLLVRAARNDVCLVHGVEDAAVHRLEAVAHVRKRAGHDDGHGVLQEGGLHLLCHLDRLERSAVDVLQVQTRARFVRDGVRERSPS